MVRLPPLRAPGGSAPRHGAWCGARAPADQGCQPEPDQAESVL